MVSDQIGGRQAVYHLLALPGRLDKESELLEDVKHQFDDDMTKSTS